MLTKRNPVTFWDHLEELFYRLRIILIAVFLSGFIVGFFPVNLGEWLSIATLLNPAGYTPLVSMVLKFIQADVLPSGIILIAGGLMDTAYVYLVLSLLIGFMISSPITAYELYQFVNPALYPEERKWLATFIVAFLGLFAFGAILSYKVIIPLTFKILLWFITSAGAAPFINIRDYMSMVITLIIGVGVVYTAPVFVVMLVGRRVLSARTLEQNRKISYAGFLIVSAILTPDPTILTDIVLMIPFIILFEATVVVSKHIERNRR